MKTLVLAALSIGVLTVLAAAPAQAQAVNSKARQKASWYNSPREIQIIDERPVVRDFREAPQHAQSIQLPPGPGDHRGMYGGGGGAMPDEASVIPSGGMPIGGGDGDPGYKLPVDTNPVPLDKGDFNHAQTNIPSGGIGPKGPLPPGGYTTGVHGAVSPPKYPQGMSAGPAQAGRRANAPAIKQTPVAQYQAGGGYGASVGSGGGQGGANTNVKGVLLNKIK